MEIIDISKEKPDFHFIAVGGVGQSALAKILLQLGYSVSGSDIQESKYVKLVRSLGGTIYIGHKEENLVGSPKVVISSAIKEDNPELIKARKLGLEVMHRSDCLKLISEKFEKFIGCAGTHGKTTTSGLLSFVLEKMEQNPSFAIGGIIPEYNINASAKVSSKYFVAELDESDGTIQKYLPDYFLINNLEADHPDFYKNGLEDIIPVFEKVAQHMLFKDNAKIFINIDDFGCLKFLEKTKFKDIVSFSVSDENADYFAKEIKFEDLNSSFDIYKNGEFLGKMELILPGLHNVYNALAVVSILDNLGFEFSSYAPFFKEFSGMGRRFQLVCETKGIKIIDDYAHHPSEIKSTINSIKDVKRRKVAIFQPHRYTRLKALWDEFLECFYDVDELFVVDVFCAGDKPSSIYNSQNFVEFIKEKGVKAEYIEGTMEEAAKKIAPKLKENDLVLTLGAGDITKIGGLINDLLAD